MMKTHPAKRISSKTSSVGILLLVLFAAVVWGLYVTDRLQLSEIKLPDLNLPDLGLLDQRTPKSPPPEPFDLIISGGTVLDGTSKPRFEADVGISGDRIAAIGELRGHPAKRRIDATGLFVAPGFINPHSHIDDRIDEERDLAASLLQGITTELVGMDGESPVDVASYLDSLQPGGLGVNYGTLVGQGAVRRWVRGNAGGRATPAQLRRMEALVRKALDAGAFGLSTGLEYPPGRQTPTDEIVALARIVAEYGGVYATHIRNERHRVLSAVGEAVRIARDAGVTVAISHIKVSRRPGWPVNSSVLVGLAQNVKRIVQDARSEGLSVWADTYPYEVPWFLTNRQLAEVRHRYPADIFYLSRTSNAAWRDRRLADLAADWGVSPGVAIGRILREDPGARVAVGTVDPRVLRLFVSTEFTMFSVDAPSGQGRWGSPWGNTIHPRGYGAYPRALGRFVRDETLLTWEEGVHKATGLPAKVYGIEQRGMLRTGYFADVVVFDPHTIVDRATYAEPTRPPAGIHYVIVNGRIAVEGGRLALQGEGGERESGEAKVESKAERPVRAGRVLRRKWERVDL